MTLRESVSDSSARSTEALAGLNIPGTWNARDIGGVSTGDGRRMRTGVVLRTAGLAGLTDDGVRSLATLGVSTVVDLRGADERARDGVDRVPPSVEVIVRAMEPPVSADDTRGRGASADVRSLMAALAGSADPQRVMRAMMARVYETFVLDASVRRAVGAAVTDIAAAPGACVVHCTAGKDRTGWIVALVQYLCGVDEQTRLDEYLASRGGAAELAAVLPELPDFPVEALAPLTGVAPEYLAGAWDLAEREYGGIDEYLAVCGVGEVTRAALVSRLVA